MTVREASLPAERVLRPAAALLLTAAAVIHAAFAPPHMGEQPLYGIFFLGAAVFQFGGAILALRSRSEPALAAVINGNATFVILWLVTRMAPLLTPTAAWAEPIGYADTLSTVLEIGAVVSLGLVTEASWLARRVRRVRVPRSAVLGVVAGLSLVLVLLVGAAVSTAGSHEPARSTAAQPRH